MRWENVLTVNDIKQNLNGRIQQASTFRHSFTFRTYNYQVFTGTSLKRLTHFTVPELLIFP